MVSILSRLALLALALIAANLVGFAYGHLALRVHRAGNPFGSGAEASSPVGSLYLDYARSALRLDLGVLPIGTGAPISSLLWGAAGASLGLLALAFVLSITIGLFLGLRAVHAESARPSPWLVPLSALGQALPGFYLGTLFIVPRADWDARALAIRFRLLGAAGVTQEQRLWLLFQSEFEFARIVWLESDGELRGFADSPYRPGQMAAMDREATIYLCGSLRARNRDGECRALAADEREPLWTVPLEQGWQVNGGALVPGRLYVTTFDGVLYAIDSGGGFAR